ncbi:MAG: ATP-binding cassette domain-containing protein [Candidatus Bipolaricaulia bacterium]
MPNEDKVDGAPVVQMKRISKRFGGIRALQRVDFELNHDEIVGLVGDNGAGKSTLIKILAGVYSPNEGEILFEGRQVTIRNPKDAKLLGIETVYQELALVDNIDVAGNIFLGREPTRFALGNLIEVIDRRKMRREARQLLNRLKINVNSIGARVGELSGGQRQAVALSRALYTEPKVVIMDEPTSALAVKEVRKVLDLMVQLKERGVSVIFISHTLQEILSVADRIFILRKGRKVGDKRVEDTTLDEIVKLMVGGEEGELGEPAA